LVVLIVMGEGPITAAYKRSITGLFCAGAKAGRKRKMTRQ
jgi:hypothetical protein